nr:hypothetical protein [Tanacetum cinerariifolium]
MFWFSSICDLTLMMRTKMNLKFPQNLKDFVHSINTTQTKNKGTELKKKRRNEVNKNMDTKVNRGQKKDCESNQSVKKMGSKDREKVDDLNNGDGCVSIVTDEHVTPSPSLNRDNVDEISRDCLNNVDSIKITRSGDNADLNGSKSEIGTKYDSVKKGEINEELVNNEKKENVTGTLFRKFFDVVNDNKIDNKLEVISTVIDENGNEVVELNDEMIEIGCQKWQKIACGFFVGCHVTYSEARAEPNKLPVWVKILNVPMEAWSIKGISALASSIGKPIIMVDITAKMCAKGEGRLGFARVLIEIDAGKKIKNEIKVMYKGNAYHEGFSKILQEKVKPTMTKNNVKENVEVPYNVVHNWKDVVKNNAGGGKSKENDDERGSCSREGSSSIGSNVGTSILGEEMNEWNDDMKRYYRDKKELIDAARLIENEENVINENCGNINEVISKSKQYMLVLMETLDHKSKFYCTMIYASNSRMERKKLWRDLEIQRLSQQAILGSLWETLVIVQKLKILKRDLKKLSWKKRNVFERAKLLRDKVKECHRKVDSLPHDKKVKEESCRILKEYQEAIKEEYSLLCQKANVEWLKEGDKNTDYFYKTIKERVHRGRIMTIRNDKGIRFENEDVAKQIVSHFEKFLGETGKALGPDGYTARFYKSAWSIVGKEVILAVGEFFDTGKLLGEVNATLISLVPKYILLTRLGKELKFKIGEVWKDLCSNNTKVDWCSMVWFSQVIPRHAFVLLEVCILQFILVDDVLTWTLRSKAWNNRLLCTLVNLNMNFVNGKPSAEQTINEPLAQPKVVVERKENVDDDRHQMLNEN